MRIAVITDVHANLPALEAALGSIRVEGSVFVPDALPPTETGRTQHHEAVSWHYLTERNLEKMGALFAELHHHGASWTPPAGFTTRRFEHWLSRGEENRPTIGASSWVF